MSGTYDGLKVFFSDIITSTKSIGEAWQELGKRIMKIIADMAAQWLASRITMALFPALTPTAAPSQTRGGISVIPGQYVCTAAETKKMLSQSAE